jgi:hypothetical protein
MSREYDERAFDEHLDNYGDPNPQSISTDEDLYVETMANKVAEKVIAAIGDPLKVSAEFWLALGEAFPVNNIHTYPLGYGAYTMRMDIKRQNENELVLEFRAPNNQLLLTLRLHP